MSPSQESGFEGYTSGWYDYRREQVCLSFWQEGKRLVDRKAFNWYFYLHKDDYREVRKERVFKHFVTKAKRVKGQKHVRVYASQNRHAKEDLFFFLEKRGIVPLEGDVDPLTRYMIDNNVQLAKKLKILYFDLETDPRVGFAHMEKARVLSVASSLDGAPVECDVLERFDNQSEKKLLRTFLSRAAEADILVAWNGDRFDEPVLSG